MNREFAFYCSKKGAWFLWSLKTYTKIWKTIIVSHLRYLNETLNTYVRNTYQLNFENLGHFVCRSFRSVFLSLSLRTKEFPLYLNLSFTLILCVLPRLACSVPLWGNSPDHPGHIVSPVAPMQAWSPAPLLRIRYPACPLLPPVLERAIFTFFSKYNPLFTWNTLLTLK